jgi:hypothetical protein
MPPVSDIVSITISRDTRPPTRSAFGVLLIAGDSGVLPDKDVVVMTWDAQMVASNQIDGDVDGVAITPVVWNANHDTTMADLATELLLAAGVGTAVPSDVGAVGYDNTMTVTATNVDTLLQLENFVVTLGASQPTITIVHTSFLRTKEYESLAAVGEDFATTDPEYIAATAFFEQDQNPGVLKIGRVDAAEDWDDALDAIVAQDDDWYALVATERTIADVEDVMDWTELHAKLFITASDDANILNAGATSDIAYYASNGDLDRSAVLYHEAAALDYPDAAWAAIGLSFDPGESTWKFKELTNFDASVLTDGQRTAAKGKSANTYETFGDRDITAEGTVGSTEFIDVIRGIDWLDITMAAAIFDTLATAPKIPYTDPGLATLEADVRTTLDDAIAVGLLRADPDTFAGQPYRVTVAKVSDIDPAQRALRNVPATAITFDAKLAGAVHYAGVSGTVAV